MCGYEIEFTANAQHEYVYHLKVKVPFKCVLS